MFHVLQKRRRTCARTGVTSSASVRLIGLPSLIASLAFSGGACSDLKPSSWTGSYAYSYSAGKNKAQTGVVVDYKLELKPGKCVFSAEGYQTDEIILCTTMSLPSGLAVKFKSYGDGKVTDLRGNAVYSVGDTLFALEKKGGEIVTHWEGYPLPDDKPHRPTIDFRRVR